MLVVDHQLIYLVCAVEHQLMYLLVCAVEQLDEKKDCREGSVIALKSDDIAGCIRTLISRWFASFSNLSPPTISSQLQVKHRSNYKYGGVFGIDRCFGIDHRYK